MQAEYEPATMSASSTRRTVPVRTLAEKAPDKGSQRWPRPAETFRAR